MISGLHNPAARRIQSAFLGAALVSFPDCALAATSGAAAYEPSAIAPPQPLREFRGAWVASVANLDWPSRKGLSTAEQKAELLVLLDRAAQLKLNVIIFQVRPACDALYASRIEPWSEYITGTMGKAPQPLYDPLTFALEEAHKRGLELHAWFNPFRARGAPSTSPVAANHVSKAHPRWVRRYGSQAWLDPGEREVQDYSLSVVMDVVRRYDIDGVHFDDYFYPYPEKDRSGNDLDFPDYSSWKRFGFGGRLNRGDWRRENINGFVHRVYDSIKAAKPWVQFGVSPFGIWRPVDSPRIRGFDAYSRLYADSRKWLANNWVDYLAPQLYWSIDSPDQSFPALLKWWSDQNVKGRHLIAGIESANTNTKWKVQEILNQINLTRRQPGVAGQIQWDMKTLMQNSALATALTTEAYRDVALVPASPWLGGTRLEKPILRIERGGAGAGRPINPSAENGSIVTANWEASGPRKPWLWLLQTRTGNIWKTETLPVLQSSRVWTGTRPEVIALRALDRNGNASLPATMQLVPH